MRKFASLGASVAFTYAASAERANALVDALGATVKAYQSDASSFTQAGP